MYKSYYNYFDLEKMTFRISHHDLHALGDPHYLIFTYDRPTKRFYLIPIPDQDKEYATQHISDAYYAAIERECGKYPQGDYGPSIILDQSLQRTLKRHGFDIHAEYVVPSRLLPFSLNGKDVQAMYYFMKDARLLTQEVTDIINSTPDDESYRRQIDFGLDKDFCLPPMIFSDDDCDDMTDEERREMEEYLEMSQHYEEWVEDMEEEMYCDDEFDEFVTETVEG